MKKILIAVIALLALGATSLGAAAPTDLEPVLGRDINDGTYKIEVESSSSMFRVTDCELKVHDGEMSAAMTLSGTGYEKLFMGSAEEALVAPDSRFVYFEEGPDGKYTYTVPVKSLNTDVPCAAFSIRKQLWYDRTLVFKAESLPEGALKAAASPVPFTLLAAAALVIAAAVAAIILKK